MSDNVASWNDLDNVLPSVQWDWTGWLPRGFLTILASEPGAGKSHLCLRLVACYLSVGEQMPLQWPDGTSFDAQPGAVIWCESEAGQALNVQRARRMDLDFSRILTPVAPLKNFRFDDKENISALTRLAAREDVRFIILDSLRGLRLAAARSMPVAHILTYLTELARGSGKPILLTHHLRKRTLVDARAATTDRLLGSSVVAQAARVIWIIDAPHPLRPHHRRLSVIKSNLGPFPEPLGFTIDDDGMHFGPAPRPPDKATRIESAAQFLLEILAEGPLPYSEIEEQSRAAGHALGTIRRAKQLLAVESIKRSHTSGWYWSLPSQNEEA